MIQVHLFSELNQLHSDYRVPPLDVNLGLVDMELKYKYTQYELYGTPWIFN